MSKCTAMSPDWQITKDITDCCLQHDADYVVQTLTKTEADLHFYDCLKDHTDIVSATFIFLCASIGGILFWYRRKLKTRKNK